MKTLCITKESLEEILMLELSIQKIKIFHNISQVIRYPQRIRILNKCKSTMPKLTII